MVEAAAHRLIPPSGDEERGFQTPTFPLRPEGAGFQTPTFPMFPLRPEGSKLAPRGRSFSVEVLDIHGVSLGSDLLLQPIMPLDLPVKVRPWELTVYPRSHIRR